MQTHSLTPIDKEPTRVRGISLRDSQWEWLYEQAEQNEGGNVSRVLRIIVDHYREKVAHENGRAS